MEPELENPQPEAPQQDTDWIALILTVLTMIWMVPITLVGLWMVWLVDKIAEQFGAGLDWRLAFIWIVYGFILLLPFIFVPFIWKNRRYRGIFQSWLLGIGYIFLLTPIRLVGETNVQLANLLQIILTAVFVALLILLARRRGKVSWQPPTPNQIAAALLLTSILTLPWLLLGALGSPLDTLLNLIASLLFGLAVALIVTTTLMPAIYSGTGNKVGDIILGGFVLGTLLLIMGAGLGFTTIQLLLMFVLPGLGWAAAVLGYAETSSQPARVSAITLLIGLAAAGPALFIDPDEFNIILGLTQRDLLTWAIIAGLAVMVLSWIVSIGAVAVRAATDRPLPKALLLGSLAAFALIGLLAYIFVGQPGFYGEQLFVIMKDQVNLDSAVTMTDYDARRTFVYDTLVDHANTTQADIRDNLDSFGFEYTPYYLVNAIAVDGGPLLRLWLSSRPEVDRVLDNPILRPLPTPAETAVGDTFTPPSGLMWNQTIIHADQVWSEFGVTGQGIVIGQSDSGIQGDHPELAGSYRGLNSGSDYNWLDPWYETAVPTDIGGHGTHTLGSILGVNTGIAPGAEWFGCVNLARNLANPALYLDCMQFLLAPYPLGGDPFVDGDPLMSAHILNNSWGCPPIEGCDAESLVAGVKALRAAGIFVVVSAGNEGEGGCETVSHPLAIYDDVFSVGAIDEFGNLGSFSSLGPVTVDGSGRTKPDIVAPGVDVFSAFPNSSYNTFSGTSMAGPHVAGVVALVWSANPALIGQIDRTEEILIDTVQPYNGYLPPCVDGSQNPNNGAGYGIIDAYAAVQMALNQSQ